MPQALCLCPTRELALQHLAVLQKIAKYTGARCTSTASPYATARRAAGGGRPKQRTLTHQVSRQEVAASPSLVWQQH